MDNFNLNDILNKISNIDKAELEENLKKAKHILDNSNINLEKDKNK